VNKINIFEALAANANGGMVTWPHLPPMPLTKNFTGGLF
jgi:hypothetical protein